MENQTAEDKLSVLNTIFGNDLTQSTITRTLHENNDAFDSTVEKLLTLPANKPQQPAQPAQPQQSPMDPASMDNIKRLHNMFSDLTQSVITTVYETSKRDIDGTVDTLLNMTSNEVAGGARRESEIARQEQEMKAYEEFKRLQQQLEEERRQMEIKAKEEKRVEEEARKKEEHNKALQEQEKMFLEFQRKKAEEEQKKRVFEQQKKASEEQQKKALEEQQKKALEERKKALERASEEQKRAFEEKQKKVLEEQQKKTLEEKKALEEQRRKIAEEIETERIRFEEAIKAEKENTQKLVQERKREEERRKDEQREKDRLLQEEIIAKKRLEEENQRLLHREEEERRRFAEKEKLLREEQDNARKEYEERVKKMEAERRAEEQKRRTEEEERVKQQEADMKKILELERLKLDEQRKKVEEEKKKAEGKLKALELATKRREEESKKKEEEEIRRKAEEEERKRLAEEQKRREEEEQKKREEEERERLLKEEERMRKEMINIKAQEQFAASAVMIPPSNSPQVDVHALVEGNEIKGAWRLDSGTLPNDAWLGLFAKRSINTNSGYMYLGKENTSGEFSFKNLTPGHYEVRIFSAKPVTSRIVETAPLRVGPTVITFNIQMQEQQIAANYQLDPPAIPSNRDWIGIYQKDNRKNREYLTSVYGNANGTVVVQIPRTPGVYEARLFAAGSSYNDSAAQEFVVEDHDRITAEHTEGKVKARWVMKTVETTNSDWIGLFSVGEPSQKYLASVYTQSASTGSSDITLPKDLPSGSYELRLFSYKIGKYVPFKTSNVITIV